MRTESVSKGSLDNWVDTHPDSLGLCRAYSNTRKHVTRKYPGELIALITSIMIDSKGCTVTIGYGPWDQPTAPLSHIDALRLAEQCEGDWRDFLTQHNIPLPPSRP